MIYSQSQKLQHVSHHACELSICLLAEAIRTGFPYFLPMALWLLFTVLFLFLFPLISGYSYKLIVCLKHSIGTHSWFWIYLFSEQCMISEWVYIDVWMKPILSFWWRVDITLLAHCCEVTRFFQAKSHSQDSINNEPTTCLMTPTWPKLCCFPATFHLNADAKTTFVL